MEYRLLGSTGVSVSQLCFGTMSFGGDADEATSAAMYRRCREAGINFFDCANVYPRGRVGRDPGQADRRRAGRAGDHHQGRFGTMGEDVNGERAVAPAHHAGEVEDSLRRLGTDRIDLYFVHRFDADDADRGDTARARRSGDARARSSTRRSATGRRGRSPRRWASAAREGLAALRVHPAHVQPGQAPGRGRDPAPGRRPSSWA